jgi:hypothetical protein
MQKDFGSKLSQWEMCNWLAPVKEKKTGRKGKDVKVPGG